MGIHQRRRTDISNVDDGSSRIGILGRYHHSRYRSGYTAFLSSMPQTPMSILSGTFCLPPFCDRNRKAPLLFCYAQCNNGACRVLSFCRNYRKLTVYCLDKINETPFERDIISSNCECCVTSFINLVKEVAYPIFLILSRRSKRTVDVAKIFFVCRMSMAI